MTSCKDYMLFLIEMFIRHTDCAEMAKYSDTFFGPTTVCYGFLDIKPCQRHDLMIFTVDRMFRPDPGPPVKFEIFNTGKSILFAIPPEIINTTEPLFYVRVQLVKVRFKPTMRYHVGSGVIDFSSEFAVLCKLGYAPPRHYNDKRYRIGTDGSCIFDGDIWVYDRRGKMSGKVRAYSRMSQLGQSVVTSFDAPIADTDHRSFTFRSESQIDEKPKMTVDMSEVRADEVDELYENEPKPSACYLCKPPKYICPVCRKNGVKVRDLYPLPLGDQEASAEAGCGSRERSEHPFVGTSEEVDHSLRLVKLKPSSEASESFAIFEVSKPASTRVEDKESQYPLVDHPTPKRIRRSTHPFPRRKHSRSATVRIKENGSHQARDSQSVRSAPVRRATGPDSSRQRVSRSAKDRIEESRSQRPRVDSPYEKSAPARRAITGPPTPKKAPTSATVQFKGRRNQRSRVESPYEKSTLDRRPISKQKASAGSRRKV